MPAIAASAERLPRLVHERVEAVADRQERQRDHQRRAGRRRGRPARPTTGPATRLTRAVRRDDEARGAEREPADVVQVDEQERDRRARSRTSSRGRRPGGSGRSGAAAGSVCGCRPAAGASAEATRRSPRYGRRHVIDSQRQVDTLAEFGDASVRVLQRRGSLVGVPGRTGLSALLYRRWGNRGNAVVTAIGSFLALAVSGTIAWIVSEPLVFPSLGATAFLCSRRRSRRSRARATRSSATSRRSWPRPCPWRRSGSGCAERLRRGDHARARGGGRAVGRAHRRRPPASALGAPAGGCNDDHRQFRPARRTESDARGRRRRRPPHRLLLAPEPRDRRAGAGVGGARLGFGAWPTGGKMRRSGAESVSARLGSTRTTRPGAGSEARSAARA